MCPLCKKTFQKRPELEINRTLREITDQFRPMTGEGGVRIEKRGGRGGRNRGMPVNFIYELKKKLPQHQLKTALTLPDAQGKTKVIRVSPSLGVFREILDIKQSALLSWLHENRLKFEFYFKIPSQNICLDLYNHVE